MRMEKVNQKIHIVQKKGGELDGDLQLGFYPQKITPNKNTKSLNKKHHQTKTK